jgi:hypothetical protein
MIATEILSRTSVGHAARNIREFTANGHTDKKLSRAFLFTWKSSSSHYRVYCELSKKAGVTGYICSLSTEIKVIITK